jgi:hypothetical protein
MASASKENKSIVIKIFVSILLHWGTFKKMTLRFLEDFGPPPPCVNLCHFAIPPLINMFLTQRPTLISNA